MMASGSTQMTSSSNNGYGQVPSANIDQSEQKRECNVETESNLIGQQITLKKITENVNGTITYEIESLQSHTKPLPDLINASSNQWLFLQTFKCNQVDENQTQWTHFSIALIVILLQILSYVTLTYYLISSINSDVEERAGKCYGTHCTTKEQRCMHLSAGSVTALLLVGFLFADFINTFAMIKESILGKSHVNRGQLLGSIIILVELVAATVCGILVGIYSGSEFDAVNGAVGILFVHELDEKIFGAMDVIGSNLKKIFALILWIILAMVIAMPCACIYTNGSWFSGAHNYCKKQEFKCDDGECIWKGFVCNGESDCRNGEDEHMQCDYSLITCPDDMFMCKSTGTCIEEKKQCNGILDCDDGSDEDHSQNCAVKIANISCNENGFPIFQKRNDSDWYQTISNGMFKCNNGQCIEAKYMCDGVPGDCLDKSDEYPIFDKVSDWPFMRQCPYGRLIKCDSDQVLCKLSGKCISKMRLCDGYEDCPGDGQDELNCESRMTRTEGALFSQLIRDCDGWIGIDSFLCGGPIMFVGDNYNDIILFENRTAIDYQSAMEVIVDYIYLNVVDNATEHREYPQCIPWQYRCDGISDCSDSSDEISCDRDYFDCSTDQYQCESGDCIPKEWVKDGYSDCPKPCDDEGECGYVSINGTLISCNEYVTGSITKNVATLFYVINIPCSYNAVQFTTCYNDTFVGASLFVSDEHNGFQFYNDGAINTNWPCNINLYASTVTINSKYFGCNIQRDFMYVNITEYTTYSIGLEAKNFKESFGNFTFQAICSKTDF
eukprot:395438_1